MKYLNAVLLLCMFASSARATFTLTVSTIGPISTAVVISSPAGISCGPTCSANFTNNSTVTLTALQSSTATFAGWGGSAGCPTNSPNCNVLMSSGKSVSARFNPVLSLSLFGNGAGTVTDASGTVNCNITNGCASGAVLTQSYLAGTFITLTASASTNSTFYGWTGGGCSGTGTCHFTMNSSKVIIATFTSAGPFSITVSTGGTGRGLITSSPVGISCGSTNTVCSFSFAGNTTVTLTATPNSGFNFAGWSNGGCSGTSTCVITSTSTQQSTGGSQSPSASFY